MIFLFWFTVGFLSPFHTSSKKIMYCFPVPILGYSLLYQVEGKGIFWAPNVPYTHVIPGIILLFIFKEYCVIPLSLWASFLNLSLFC
jgi:hypothetical protein